MIKPQPKAAGRPETIPTPAHRRTDRHPLDPPMDAPPDPPADAEVGVRADSSADPIIDPRAEAPDDGPEDRRTRAPARVGEESRTDGAVRHGEGPTGPFATPDTGEAVREPEGAAQADLGDSRAAGSAGLRRDVDVTARSYKGGLARLTPRVDRLAAAVRAVLDAGASVTEVRAMLAEAGLEGPDVPTSVIAMLRRKR